MHPNPAFRQIPPRQSLDFARAQGFGLLTAAAAQGEVLLSHLPFVLAEDGASARLHLVRSNPLVRAVRQAQTPGRLPAKIAVQGPQAYISPDWYGLPDQVPTWNYVAVHLEGTLVALEQAEIRAVVDEITAFFEAQVPGKRPWDSAKMSPERLERMLIQIVPFGFEITAVQGTWKLGQNKSDAARASAAQAVTGSRIGSETGALAALMLDLPQEEGKSEER